MTATADGAGAAGLEVTFTADGGATFVGAASCTTETDGTCTVTVTKTDYGVVSVGASAAGGSSSAVSVAFQSPWAVDASASTPQTIAVGASGTDLGVTVDGVTTNRPSAVVKSLDITGSGGDKDLNVDLTGGAVAAPITFDGGGGGAAKLTVATPEPPAAPAASAAYVSPSKSPCEPRTPRHRPW